MMSVMESITADIHYIWFAATQQYVSLHEGDDELHCGVHTFVVLYLFEFWATTILERH